MLGLDEKLLTVKEVLEIAKVSRYTLHRSVKSGKIPAIYIGSNVRFKESDAMAYAEYMGQNPRVLSYREKEGS